MNYIKKIRIIEKIILSAIMAFLLIGCSIKQEEGTFIYQLPNQSYSQMMSYIISNIDGDTIVIDGGTGGDMEYLVEQILSITKTGKIDAWFLTHYHKDHTGALAKYLSTKDTKISVENIYYQFPQEEWVSIYEPNRYEDITTINQKLSKQGNINIIEKGDYIDFDGFSIESLRNIDVAMTVNAGNNSSMVYKVHTETKTLLFLGDLGIEAGNEVLIESRDKISNIDYVQMAHHGQGGVNEEFYKVVNPKYCLWPTPKWLWENKDGTYKTDETKEWIKKMDVKNNYIVKDGLCKIKVS